MKIEWIKEQKNKIIQLLCLVSVPAAAFYLMECYTHNPLSEVRTWAQLFNVILFELIAWILYFLVGRVRTALRIELVIAMVFGLSNAYVVRFRTNPIVPWDLFSWKTAASVASNYDFKPDTRMVVVTILFLAGIALLQFVKKESGTIKIWKRLILAAAFCVVLTGFVGKLQDESFQMSHRLYPFLFTPAYMTTVNGIAVTFAMDLAYVTVEKPSGYQASEEQAVLEQYGEQETESTDELPNIVAVMNESFSDLAVLGDFTVNEDYMPYLHRLQQGNANTVTGYLNVSVCGGNTANTEFEFLTGNTMAFLPQGSIPYQQYITGEIDSLPSYLARLGIRQWQRILTMRPAGDGILYIRFSVFRESIFRDQYWGASQVRKYVSDDSCVDKIIQLYEGKEEGKPLFVFNVTMQNHGGYTDLYDNFTPEIQVEGVNSTAVSQYLSLIRLSDASLEKLIQYFSGVDEKTIVVFFGDHQPNDTVAAPILAKNGISVKNMDAEQLKLRYQVPYVIWANYDIGEETGKDTSANYLAADVLRYAGVAPDAYLDYLSGLKEQYPIISAMRVVTADGEDTDATAQKEGLSDYQKLQYYQLFDHKEKE